MEIDFSKLPKFKNAAYEIIPLIPQWAQTYEVPQEAIIRQLAFAHGWIQSNPKKAPKKSMTRFLYNWFKKAQEMGNLRVTVALPPPVHHSESDLTFEDMQAMRLKNFGQVRKFAGGGVQP